MSWFFTQTTFYWNYLLLRKWQHRWYSIPFVYWVGLKFHKLMSYLRTKNHLHGDLP